MHNCKRLFRIGSDNDIIIDCRTFISSDAHLNDVIFLNTPFCSLSLAYMNMALCNYGAFLSIVFTKADKLSKGKASANVRKYLDELSKQWEELPPHFLTSSETKQGREEVLDYIDEIIASLGTA